jgi:hypothetical protein
MTEESRALERLERQIACIDEKLDRVRTEDLPSLRVEVAREIAALKVKAGVWGVIGGVLASVGALLVSLMLRGAHS